MDWAQFRKSFPAAFGKRSKQKLAPPEESDADDDDAATAGPADAAASGAAQGISGSSSGRGSASAAASAADASTASTDARTEEERARVAASRQAEAEEDFVGPPRPASDDEDADGSDDDSGDDSDDSDSNPYDIPTTYSVEIGGHTKPVTALAVDPSGARFVTGGFDYSIRFYDFGGMDSRFNAFRTLPEPCGSHQIRSLAFSITGDQFLIAPASNRAKILDRDGHALCEFQKGDMYLVDLANTKGHVGALTGGVYHPQQRNTVLTWSEDSTARTWDLNNVDKCTGVAKHRNPRGQRLPVQAAAYKPEGGAFVTATAECALQMWPERGPFSRPQLQVRETAAHYDTLGVSLSRDGTQLLHRCSDDALRVWDVRKFTAPLMVYGGLPALFDQTDVIYSPAEDLFVTGTAQRKEAGAVSRLVFFDRASLRKVHEVPLTAGAIRLCWHPKLNQIFVSGSDARTHVFYDPEMSVRGVVMCAGRTSRRVDAAVADDLVGTILTPHALPAFRDPPNRKRAKAKEAKDPRATRRPEMPPDGGVGRGGRVGSTFQHYLVKNLVSKPDLTSDPREAILKYAEEAQSNPIFTKAYAKTQPVKILQTEDGRIIRK